MSRENVNVVRRAFRYLREGDLSLEQFDSQAVTTRMPPAPDTRTYHGRDGVVQAMLDWVEGFSEWEMTGEELIDAGGDQVLVRVHQRALSEHGRVPVEADFWFVYTVRDLKIARLDMYVNKADALEAAGFPE